METAVESLIAERSNLRRVSVPEVHDWVNEEEAEPYVYNKGWDEAKLDPWIIFHTSGTTGTKRTLALIEDEEILITTRSSETNHIHQLHDDFH